MSPKPWPTRSPTKRTYNGLIRAYDFFNAKLFGGELPPCLITLQRGKKFWGYYSEGRFKLPDGTDVTDEIALNPEHFREGMEQVFSTLVHEMVHLWQAHFGRTPRRTYHDRQWAEKMKEVGLQPTSTGFPGGKETGQRVLDFVMDGGPYQRALQELNASGIDDLYVEVYSEKDIKARRASNASKTLFMCPNCRDEHWYGRPRGKGDCHRCGTPFRKVEVHQPSGIRWLPPFEAGNEVCLRSGAPYLQAFPEAKGRIGRVDEVTIVDSDGRYDHEAVAFVTFDGLPPTRVDVDDLQLADDADVPVDMSKAIGRAFEDAEALGGFVEFHLAEKIRTSRRLRNAVARLVLEMVQDKA